MTISQAEIYEVIGRVAKNHRNKCFGSYTKQDIEQEVWIIALEVLPKFEMDKGTQKDPKRALEYWLNKVMTNKLKNLYRDKFIVPQRLHKEGCSNNLLSAINIDDVGEVISKDNLENIVGSEDLSAKIIDQLSDSDLEILDSLLSGENIPSYYKTKLLRKIKDVVNG